jgi:membrane fusion protein, heavy metal efflux system
MKIMNHGVNITCRLFVLLLIIVTACEKKPAAPGASEPEPAGLEETNNVEVSREQLETAGIRLGKVEYKQISGTIRVNGVLDAPPQQLVSVSAPIGGFLKNTDLLQGSRVKKGQVLATIENLEFIQIQQDYLEAKNQLDFARADYERQQKLARENVNSEKVLQQSKTNFISWQGKYNGLKEKLNVLNLNTADIEAGNIRSSINLFSPIHGYVTQVNVNIGKFVNPADVLFVIVDTEHLHAELVVFEKDIPKVKIGQKVRFTLANESVERMATVYLIGREIGADRTIRIHCHLDKEDKELLPGMYLSALVETGGALSPAVPDEAVIDYQGKKYLFVATADTSTVQGHFTMVEIQTGENELGYTAVAIDDSLKEKRIVIKGAYSLLSKMKNTEEGE